MLRVSGLKKTVSMKGHQFPLVSNSCTAGHKMQGFTVSQMIVNSWSYANNWAYVVLSRVKSMSGLYLRRPLTTYITKYKKPDGMKKMLKDFRDNILDKEFSDEVYNQLIQDEKEQLQGIGNFEVYGL